MGEGCGLPAVLPPTRAAIGAPPTPPVTNGRLPLPPETPPEMPGHRRPPTFLGGECWASCCCRYQVPRPLPAAAAPASGALLAPSAAPSAQRARLPDAPVQPPSPPALGLADPAPFSFFLKKCIFLSLSCALSRFPRAGHNCCVLPATRCNKPERTRVWIYRFFYFNCSPHEQTPTHDYPSDCPPPSVPGAPF